MILYSISGLGTLVSLTLHIILTMCLTVALGTLHVAQAAAAVSACGA